MKAKVLSIFLLSFFLGLSSCENFLEEEPKQFITTETFYQTESDATAAINAVYSSLSTFGAYRSNMLIYDEVRSPFGSMGPDPQGEQGREIDEMNVNSEVPQLMATWEALYEGINSANLVLENIPDANLNDEFKNQILSQAHFLRGVIYFDLARLWGNVPIILQSTKGDSNRDVTNSPRQEVLDQAEADLKLAAGEGALDGLPETWSGADNGRAALGAANGLLARLNLYQGRFNEVLNYTEKVMQSGSYSLFDNYADNFATANKYGQELVYIIDFHNDVDPGLGITRLLNPRNVRIGETNRDGQGRYVATQMAWDMFDEPGDIRLEQSFWIEFFDNRSQQQIVMDTTKAPYYVAKWKLDQAIAPWGWTAHAWPVIRYADILLMHAEAVNEVNGPTAQAFAAINQVRQRARIDANDPTHLPDLAGLSQDELRQEIYEERVREFLFEGSSFNDIIRTNRFSEMFPGVDAKFQWLPIPQRELDLNANLNQNTGF
nr:RagB/SusD family nutrient uptake outer membrane protein [Cytophagales bacterium]